MVPAWTSLLEALPGPLPAALLPGLVHVPDQCTFMSCCLALSDVQVHGPGAAISICRSQSDQHSTSTSVKLQGFHRKWTHNHRTCVQALSRLYLALFSTCGHMPLQLQHVLSTSLDALWIHFGMQECLPCMTSLSLS